MGNNKKGSGRIGNLSINYKNDFLSINTNIDLDALADFIDDNKKSKYERIEYAERDCKLIED